MTTQAIDVNLALISGTMIYRSPYDSEPVRERLPQPSFIRLWDAAGALTPDERNTGRHWYENAREDLRERAAMYPVPLPILIPAAAALTPGLRWSRTLRVLDMLLEAQDVGAPMPLGGDATYGFRDREKAWRILATGDISECSGPKVEPFAAALGGDLEAIVVDRHLVRLSTGADVRQLHHAAMERIRAALWAVAWGLHERPAHLQAALWAAALR